ncbi:hypothetical protein [Streptacidiphilus melanogenes]|uniref:hypothetical protein n=1 Tax=Streptacidiphilus melanogenes TaxID=411235 RepID=UPI00157AA97E|nr:hypothetical protein [Streptacidiphilus melanogenes]
MHIALGRAHHGGPGRPALTTPAGVQPPPARGSHVRTHRRWLARTGSEPSTALSDLPARRMLAGIFGPVYLAGAVLFAWMAAVAKPGDVAARNTWIGFAAVCAVLALVAAVDLLVIHARMAAERRAGLSWRHDRPWVVRGDVLQRREDRPGPEG